MTSTGVCAIPLLVGAAVSLPAPRGRTLCNHNRSNRMQSDPLLGTVLTKLTDIEKSIDKLASHVAIQNGRIGKLEKAEAQERAVTEHIDRELQIHNAEANRRSHVLTGSMSALAAICGGVIAVIVERLV